MVCATTPPPRRRYGFTLIEAMLVTVIIGVGVVSMLQLLAAGTMVNGESTQLTSAVQLANHINELTARTKYADLRTITNATGRLYATPIDGRGRPLTGYGGWAQFVKIEYVEPHRLTVAVPDSQREPTSRVTVEVRRNGRTVHTSSHIVAAADWPPLN